jgi:hypothetical protein
MIPASIAPEDRFFLPPHDAVVLAKDQPQYQPLPIVQLHGPEGRVISRWVLTPDERTAIAAGADIYLEQLTFNPGFQDPDRLFQPILPTVGLRDFCPKDS